MVGQIVVCKHVVQKRQYKPQNAAANLGLRSLVANHCDDDQENGRSRLQIISASSRDKKSINRLLYVAPNTNYTAYA